MKLKFDNWFLYFSAITANIFFISMGCMLVWNSPVLPKLQSNDTLDNPLDAPITVLELSTITAVFPIGASVGTVLVGKLPDIIGRKKTLVCVAVGIILSFVGLSLANHVYLFYIFLPILSLNISAGSVVVPIYTAEIAEDHNRGNLGCLLSIGIAFGQLYAYTLGAVTNVRLFCLLCGVPPLFLLILTIFLPESPIYLSSNGEKLKALLVLKKLRKTKTLFEIEMEYTERQQIIQNKSIEEKISLRSIFRSRAVRKAFFLSISARVVQQTSGMYIVLSFLGPLLNEVGGSVHGDILAIIVAAVKFVAALVAVMIVEKAGRRLLILLATFLCSISMFVLGVYFYFKHNDYIVPDTVRFIPICCIICFVIMYTLGLSSVPYILVAELLPNEIRSVGSSIAQLAGNLCMIAMSFAYPSAAKYLGIHYCMFTFSFLSISSFIFMYVLLPETKGKSFREIRNILSK